MNEITALCLTKNSSQPILAWSPTEVFSADNFGNTQHLWEITKPWVSAPGYSTLNPAGPVPPQQSNQDKPQQFNETARMQTFGQYQGTVADVYSVRCNTSNQLSWMKATVGTWSSWFPITGANQQLELGIGIRFFSTFGFTGNEVWTFSVIQPRFTVFLGYTRWQIVSYLDSVFFVNEANTIRWIQGRTINTTAWATDQVPTGRHMVMFHDHLFISEPYYLGVNNPYTVMWSDLREFMQWDTKLFINEADQYTFDDDLDCPEVYPGITGMAELNPIRIGFGPPRLCIYTAKKIYMLEYVGLPHITQKSLLNDKVGCAFPWALVASKHMHLFIASDNFYMMEKDGEPKQIGDRVFVAFMSLLSENTTLRYKTYGYIDQVRREVWWAFCSKQSTGDFDMKVGYNYVSDTWQFAQASEHSFLHCRLPIEQGQQIQNDHAVIQDDSEPIGGILNTNYQEFRLYGQSNKKVSYEVCNPDATIDQAMAEPYLETGDIIYDPGKVVMVDGMYIHALYDPASCIGVEVAASGRAGIEDIIQWKLPPAGKLWTPDLKENKYSWPRIKGRVFRFRFTFKLAPGAIAVRRAEFFFWNEIVSLLTENAEK